MGQEAPVARYSKLTLKILGGYSNGVPPLPIPNREVKPISADGTAYRGRVGRRLFLNKSSGFLSRSFFVFNGVISRKLSPLVPIAIGNGTAYRGSPEASG